MIEYISISLENSTASQGSGRYLIKGTLSNAASYLDFAALISGLLVNAESIRSFKPSDSAKKIFIVKTNNIKFLAINNKDELMSEWLRTSLTLNNVGTGLAHD